MAIGTYAEIIKKGFKHQSAAFLMVINMFHTQRLNHARSLININQFSFSFLLLFSFIATHRGMHLHPIVFTDHFQNGIISLPLTFRG